MKRPLTIWCLVAASLVGVVAWADLVLVLKTPVTSEASPRLSSSPPVILANGGSMDWSPVVDQGSGITYSATGLPSGASINSSTGNVTGTVATGGTMMKVTATNEYGSYTLSVPVNVYDATTTIDSTWLTNEGGAPYDLDDNNTRYVLAQNVTVSGMAFAFLEANIVLDLGGYTVTYGNETPISIDNHSFETVDGVDATHADGWDFTNAGTADRYDGDYLDNEVYDGSYSLRLPTVNGDIYVENDTTITLEANTHYEVAIQGFYGTENDTDYAQSSEFGGGTPVAYVTLDNGVDTPVELSYSAPTTREIPARRSQSFTTGSSNLTYTIRVGATNTVDLGTHFWFLDYVTVSRSKSYGIVTQVKTGTGYTDRYPAYTPGDPGTAKNGHNSTITNGTITQGQGAGGFAHAIYCDEVNDICVHDVDINVIGPSTSCILGRTMQNKYISFTQCNFDSDVLLVNSRDAADGAMINGFRGEIGDNTLTDGPHFGITVRGDDYHIHDNTFTLKNRYTNGYCIATSSQATTAGADDANIRNNTMNNGTGDYAAPGMILSGGESLTVHDNTVNARYVATNPEYPGGAPAYCYAVQFEKGDNIEFYDNIVNCYSTITGAIALRFGGDNADFATNNTIRDNTFRAIRSSGTEYVYAVSFTDVTASEANTFTDNNWEFDDGFTYSSLNVDQLFTGGSYQVTGSLSDAGIIHAIDAGDAEPVELEFRNPTFADANTQNEFETAVVEKLHVTQIVGTSGFVVSWTPTLTITSGGSPLASTAVTITDSQATQVFSGTTNSIGKITPTLSDYQIYGNTTTDFNTHTLNVTGYQDATFTVDVDNQDQTIEVTAE